MRGPTTPLVRVRIGLHTGEPTVSDGGYVGLDVVRAARLCSTCRGGQVLLSASTRALLGSALPEGVGIFPVGQRQLKDIDEPEVVYELEIEGVDASPEPEPAALEAPPKSPASSERPSFDQRIEDWAETLSARIEEQVASTLERSLNWIPDPPKDD